MELIFASANEGKIKEIHQILGKEFTIKGLKDIGIIEEIPETGNTFHENALQKARYVYEKCKCDVFADDSGLEVMALNKMPGVYSAFYAGFPRSDEKNILKLLDDMKNTIDRRARFVSVICLIWKSEIFYFEGVINGSIAHEPKGNNGFGYDPVFIPDGFTQTFAELSSEIKNQISHRNKAVQKMKIFLENT